MSICIPLVNGPNLPNWWDPSVVFPAPRGYSTELDLPFWPQAYRRPFGKGTAEEAMFMAFGHIAKDNRSLYLAWHVRFAPASSPDRDRLYVGFTASATSAPLLLEITIYAEDASVAAEPAARIVAGTLDAQGQFQPLPRVPAWTERTTRVWRAPTSNLAPAVNLWAVQMQVPLVADAAPGEDAGIGVDADGSFRMWYCFDIYTPLNPAGSSADPAGGILRFGFPQDARFSTDRGQRIWPAPSRYADYHLGSQNPPSDVGGYGISLHWLTMGTPGIPASEVDPDRPNTLFARPTNHSGAQLAEGQVRARFAIANWGSVCDAGAPWTVIREDEGNRAPLPDRATPVPGKDIRFDWILPADLADAIRRGMRPRYQCLCVDLSGAGLTFVSPTVYRNMDILGASSISREAEISVVGLAPIVSKHRDVYLAVEVYNMPEQIDPAAPQPRAALPVTRGLAAIARANDGEPSELEQQVNSLNAYAYDQGIVPNPEVAQLMIDTGIPTYRVHCYHDTGEREVIDGRRYVILGLQSSFGYHLVHEGDVLGWSHRLRGAIRLADRFYVLPVTHHGVARITTSIQALEPGDMVEPDEPIQPWPAPASASGNRRWWWLLALLFLVLVINRCGIAG
ncbi:hypothetical protein [Lamprocystis purpurea]|uniref:hypothetical protein n=1 Tax=Lamprocystis purpurea TaxID=61598 RepID=UPI000380FA4A|nr:hypothetical protein [Lamprocystis purpurea]